MHFSQWQGLGSTGCICITHAGNSDISVPRMPMQPLKRLAVDMSSKATQAELQFVLIKATIEGCYFTDISPYSNTLNVLL